MFADRIGRRRTDESGQVTSALVIVMVTVLVAVSLFGILALSRGVDERSKAQTAADAAALAGAGTLEGQLAGLLGGLSGTGSLAGVGSCEIGRLEAERLAAANDATLTSYCFDLDSGDVSVEVQMNEPVSEDVDAAEASAVASTGLALGSCEFGEPTDDGGNDDDDGGGDGNNGGGNGNDGGGNGNSDPTPPDQSTNLECDGLIGDFVIDGASGELEIENLELPSLRPTLVE